MRQRLFLHYGWFLQNLEKDFIQTNMHITVKVSICSAVYSRQTSGTLVWPSGLQDAIRYQITICTYIVQLSKGPYKIFHTFLLKMQDLLGHFVPFSKDQRYRNLPIQCKKIWIKARLKLHQYSLQLHTKKGPGSCQFLSVRKL